MSNEQNESRWHLPQEAGWRGWTVKDGWLDVETAPGRKIFVSGTWNAKRQVLAIDPEEVDALCDLLATAKAVYPRVSHE